MKFLFFVNSGCVPGLAYRVQEEGNQVYLYPTKPILRNYMQGIIPQVSSLQEGLSKKPDVIVFEMVGDGEEAIRLRKKGFNVFGSGSEYKGKSFQDQIELDRAFGMKIMKDSGILIPETTEFKGFQIEKAIAQVKGSGKRYVVKMDDNKSADSSYVSEGPDDMIDHLNHVKEKKLLKPGDEFILQEFIKGVELSTEQWFSGGDPVYPANGTMETKKFMDNDLGPNTGCSSSMCWVYEQENPRIVKETIAKIHPLLKQVKYTGPLDINCIISEKDGKPYGLEWTARMGYSAIYCLVRLLDMDFGEALYLTAAGKLKEMDYKAGFSYAIRATIPPYPLDVKDEKISNKIFSETMGQAVEYEGDPENIFYNEVMEKDGNMVTAGVAGEIAEVTGYGNTLKQSVDEAEHSFDKLHLPNKQARLDGWKRPFEQIPALIEQGYAEMPDVGA